MFFKSSVLLCDKTFNVLVVIHIFFNIFTVMIMSSLVRGVKAFPRVHLQRNFGVCSVLMVNKAVTDPIQKLFLDKLKEYTRLSRCVK